MAITKKPKPQQAKTESVNIDALIWKGGSVASETHGEETAETNKTTSVMSRIDAAVAARRIKTPRHTQ